jgi:hypothetical protein
MAQDEAEAAVVAAAWRADADVAEALRNNRPLHLRDDDERVHALIDRVDTYERWKDDVVDTRRFGPLYR